MAEYHARIHYYAVAGAKTRRVTWFPRIEADTPEDAKRIALGMLDASNRNVDRVTNVEIRERSE